MEPERWARIKSICGEILDLPRAERDVAIESACGEDRELRQAVERLVSDYESGQEDEFEPPQMMQKLWSSFGSQLEPGQLLSGEYRVEGLLGRGGMAEVFRAVELQTGRPVAVKVLRWARQADEKAQMRMRREAELSKSISNPHICPVERVITFASSDGEDAVGLVMPVAPGQTLSEWLRTGTRFAVEEALAVGEQLASALDAAHAAGVIHRDLKPSNIMLENRDGQWSAQLLDLGLGAWFGTAKLFDGDLTGTGEVVGTPDYMAPEQLRGTGAGTAADQYALAAVLFEMVTGRRPTVGRNGLDEIIRRCLDAPPEAREFLPEIPTAMNEALRRGLNPDPGRRFPDCRSLLRAARGERSRGRAGWLAVLGVLGAALGWWVVSGPERARGVLERWTGIAGRKPVRVALAVVGEDRGRTRFLLEKAVGQSAAIRLERLEASEEARATEEAKAKGAEFVAVASMMGMGEGLGEARLELKRLAGLGSGRLWTESFSAAEGSRTAIEKLALLMRGWAGDTKLTEPRFARHLADITTKSEEALAAYLLGDKLAGERKRAAAVEALRKAVAFDPDFALAHYRLADVLTGLGDFDGALVHYEKATAGVDRKRTTYCEGLRIVGLFRMDVFDWAGAKPLFAESVRHCPPDPATHFYLAAAWRQDGRWKEALAELDEGERIAPGKQYLRDARAKVLWAAGEWKGLPEQVDWFERNGHRDRVAVWRGAFYELSGARGQSQADFRSLCEAQPVTETNSYGCNLWAQSLGDEGRYEEALGVLLRAAAVDEESERPKQAAAKRIAAAWAAYQLGDRRKASELAHQAVEYCSDPKILSLSAIVFRYLEQAAMLELILRRLEPNGKYKRYQIAIRRVRAELLGLRGQAVEALEEVLQASALEPPWTERTTLARAYRAVGDESRAAELLEQERNRALGHWAEHEGSLPGYLAAVIEQDKKR